MEKKPRFTAGEGTETIDSKLGVNKHLIRNLPHDLVADPSKSDIKGFLSGSSKNGGARI